MSEVLTDSPVQDYGEVIELPVRGYLFRKGRLIGVYTDGGMVSVDANIPPEAHRHFLKGSPRSILLIRVRQYHSRETIEVYLNDGHRSWLIREAEEMVGPGGFEPPTTRL